jgi:hypothetical protein
MIWMDQFPPWKGESQNCTGDGELLLMVLSLFWSEGVSILTGPIDGNTGELSDWDIFLLIDGEELNVFTYRRAPAFDEGIYVCTGVLGENGCNDADGERGEGERG